MNKETVETCKRETEITINLNCNMYKTLHNIIIIKMNILPTQGRKQTLYILYILTFIYC